MPARLSVLLLAAAATQAQDGGLTLVRDGKSSYTIVRPADSSPSQIYAAEELQKFTREMTGAELPIVTDEQPLPANAILLGKTRYTEQVLGGLPGLAQMGEDGFGLATLPPHLVILGSPVRGTLYGVYELLERYGGCRWYSSWFSVVPQKATWSIPKLETAEAPAFVMREPFWFDMFDADLAARCRANGNSMRLDARHGGQIRFGAGLFVHTFYPLVPPGTYFGDHPEYYSELGGRRTADNAQLCLTNPDVVQVLTQNLLAAIRKDPGAKLYSVAQNDCGGACQCANCRASDAKYGGPSGTLINFVNQVAENVEKEFPDVWIETLAYQYTRHPPKNVVPRRNVVPRLCSIECDFSKPLDVSKYPQNVSFVDDIKGWSALTDKLYVWDYVTSFANYVTPFPNFGSAQGNIRFFRDNHVVGLFEEGAYHAKHASFAELRAWLEAKLMWNPDQPVEPLYDDFFKGYYGAAAGPVRAYFDELHALVKPDQYNLFIWAGAREAWLTDEFLSRAAGLWQEAERLVAADPARLYNVRMGAIPAMFARLERWPAVQTRYVFKDGMFQPGGVDAEYTALATEMLRRVEEGQVTALSEGSERTRQLLEVWRGRTAGYRPTMVTGGGMSAGVVAGGIDFADTTGSLIDTETGTYQVAKAEAAEADLQRDVSGRYRLERSVTAGADGVTVTSTVVNGGAEPMKVRPVLRSALDLGDAAAVKNGNTWLPLAVPEDQIFATASLPGAALNGRELLLASKAAGRAVRLRLPDAPVERIWFLSDAAQGSVRVFVLLPAQGLAGKARLGLPLLVQPAEVPADAPDLKPAAAHRRDRLVLEECMIPLGQPGVWGDIVADPEADDGFASKLYNTHFEWCMQWTVNPDWFDRGAQYKLRMHIKVGKSGRPGSAFWAGVYDAPRARGIGGVQPATSDVQDGYQWYDIATWAPEAGQYLWVGPGPFQGGEKSAIEALYVDKYELTKVP
ncbi:MAG: DUF4838 domain-containing protein [Armatimonadetes bacterium]|nr:DUF4838 domain-containing protein [Armatimonadota bacterium]